MSSRVLPLLLIFAGACAAPPPSVSGLVTDEQGRPIAGARVRVQTAPDLPGEPPRHVLTGNDGRFLLPIVLGVSDDTSGRDLIITAGKDGWKNRGAPARVGASDVKLALDPIPAGGVRTGYRFQSGITGTLPCFQCHGGLVGDWQRSTHSTAATDKLVHDAMGPFFAFLDGGGDLGASFTDPATGQRYTVTADRSTADECAKCHAPTLALDGKSDFRAIAVDPQGDRAVREGVTCDVCHKIRAARLEDLTLPGLDLADVRLPTPDRQVLFGPYDDSIFLDTEAAYAPAMATSEGCVPCHTNARVITLAREGGGTLDRRIFGEDTFREWRFDPTTVRAVDSDGDTPASGDGPYVRGDNYAGRPLVCQDCHMRDPPPDPTTGESLAGSLPTPSTWQRVATHADAPLRHRGTQAPHGFEGATPRMVAWATELRATARRDGGEIAVDVELENRHTGHDFPSGLPDRNVLLLVTARDGDTHQVLAQSSGPRLPSWAGVSATTAGRGYARWLASARGDEGVFYAFAVRDAADDSRLRPGQNDRSSYRFTAPASGSTPVEVEVKVLHRRRFPHQIDAVKTEVLGDSLTVRIP